MTYPFKHRTVVFGSILAVLACISPPAPAMAHSGVVVVQTDFGVKDGAVSAVKGVMYNVDKTLVVSDLTHEIPAFNIWEAAYRLYQTATYWPAETVFVSVVDPGVGTKRRSIVALSKDGRYFVTPDNGALTLIDDTVGLQEVRTIDETRNRLPGSSESYTFHGRDLYGYTAARLASGKITFAEVGPKIDAPIIKLSYEKARIVGKQLRGTLVILDPQYGNAWTNISKTLMKEFGMQIGSRYTVSVYDNDAKKYSATLTYASTFGDVPMGGDLLYVNSLLNLALAKNQGNFAQAHTLTAGPSWRVVIEKPIEKPIEKL